MYDGALLSHGLFTLSVFYRLLNRHYMNSLKKIFFFFGEYNILETPGKICVQIFHWGCIIILESEVFYVISFDDISGHHCFAVSRLISWASVDRGWTGNLDIMSWCYYPLYHRVTFDRLHVTRVLNVPRDRAMHCAK